MSNPVMDGPHARRLPCKGGIRFDYDVIVVGGGMGGLSAAALLAHRGFKILVVERHHQVGGNCTSWRRRVPVNGGIGEYVFDCGVQDISGLGSNGALASLLRQIGAEDRIAWQRVQHLYWLNGARIEGGTTAANFAAELCRHFPTEADGIERFFAMMESIYCELYAEAEENGGIPLPITQADRRDWPRTHPNAFRWFKQPFHEMLQSYISSSEVRAALQTISEYITEQPQRPLVQEMAPLYGYYFEGGRYPAGGAQTLPETLACVIQEHGGVILSGLGVEEIVLGDGRVRGVRTCDGRQFSAPQVIANGDIVTALTTLVPDTALPKRYAGRMARLERGPSALVVSVALSTRMPLPARIFIQSGTLTFGVGNPSVIDPSLAPAGHSAVTILWLLSQEEATSWLDKSEPNYFARKQAAADRLFDVIEQSVFPDFRKHLVHAEIATPASFASFTSAANGNIYGAGCAGWRPGPQSPIPGLLLAGAGTETGPGIEAVVISGLRAAQLVLHSAE